MKTFVGAVVVGLLCLLATSLAKISPPKTQVYSRLPGHLEKPNTFICHVSNFHPPEIRIELLKNGQEIAEAKQTDLAFEEDWYYHLTRHAPFTPRKEDRYACRVTHMGKSITYTWDPDF